MQVDRRTVQFAKLGTFVHKEHHLQPFVLLEVIVQVDKTNVQLVFRAISASEVKLVLNHAQQEVIAAVVLKNALHAHPEATVLQDQHLQLNVMLVNTVKKAKVNVIYVKKVTIVRREPLFK